MTEPNQLQPESRPPADRIMRNLGLEPDNWQVEVLQGGQQRLLLNCCRQAGKSTVVAALALTEAIFIPGTKVLLISRSLRQSTELFRIVTDFYRRLGSPLPERQTTWELELSNFSRIVCLPCREDTIRGHSHVSLLVVDEASRVPDDVYRAVRPMLAVSNGRIICLSTPQGKRGFFYDAWAKGGADWARIEVPVERINRIPRSYLDVERRALGVSYFRQEYECSFEAVEGLVYPDFDRCVVAALPPHVSAERKVVKGSRRVGGIDFGFHNPFAAIWGTLDRDDILWLTGEHYERERPLSDHASHLPRDVMWYADPEGAGDICELRWAGFAVRRGGNAVRQGIAAVHARLGNGTLRVLEGACPNLLAEAELYTYGSEADRRESEDPVNENNHALAALRYLIMRLDARRQARPRAAAPVPAQPASPAPPARPAPDPWLRLDNEALWTTVCIIEK
jgi:hypothetical protein